MAKNSKHHALLKRKEQLIVRIDKRLTLLDLLLQGVGALLWTGTLIALAILPKEYNTLFWIASPPLALMVFFYVWAGIEKLQRIGEVAIRFVEEGLELNQPPFFKIEMIPWDEIECVELHTVGFKHPQQVIRISLLNQQRERTIEHEHFPQSMARIVTEIEARLY